MSDTITLVGRVATEPQLDTLPSGASLLKFRLASSERRRDSTTGEWTDGPTKSQITQS